MNEDSILNRTIPRDSFIQAVFGYEDCQKVVVYKWLAAGRAAENRLFQEAILRHDPFQNDRAVGAWEGYALKGARFNGDR